MRRPLIAVLHGAVASDAPPDERDTLRQAEEVAVALRRLGHGWQAATVLVAGLAWPIAHIANIAELAVPVNIALFAAFGSLALSAGVAPVPAPARRSSYPPG